MVIVLIGLTWLSTQISPGFNPATIISARQHDFMQLRIAHSKIELTPLQPDFGGLVHNFPEALNHALIRPFPWEASSWFSLALAIELWMMMMMIFYIIIKHPKIFRNPRPMIIMGICIAVFMFVISGYIIPNTNSLLRYKCIFLPLFVSPFLVRFKLK
jgi:lipopolysaccharide export LptBFGC system permease protein LptF